jgi:hypothetical protein
VSGHRPADRGGQQHDAGERHGVLERDLVERVAGNLAWQRAVEVAAEQPVADQQEDARGQRHEQRVERGQPGANRQARHIR